VNNFNYEYTSGLKSILETSFGQSQQASHEDVNEFKSMMRMKLESLEQFKDDCKNRGIRPLDMFFYMTKLYKLSKTSRIQSFGNGPSTNGLHMTILSLKKFNHMPGAVVDLDHGIDTTLLEFENVMSRKLDNVKLLSNLYIMSELGDLKSGEITEMIYHSTGLTLTDDCTTTIRSIKDISGFDRTTQKTLLMCACNLLPPNELKEKLVSWRTLNFTYLKKQKRTIKPNGEIQWSGDLSILVNSGTECYTLNQRNGYRFIECRTVVDVSTLHRSLREMMKTLGLDFNTLFTTKKVQIGTIYQSMGNKSLAISEVEGVLGSCLNIKVNKSFTYKRLLDMDSFKVRKTMNSKSREIQIFLEDQGSRTATICHSNGNLYPVEIQKSLQFNPSMWYNGVRFSRLVDNRSWFYDFKLPKMSQQEVVEFLRNDVDLEFVMTLEDTDKRKIVDYMEIHTEVNQESFGLGWTDKVLIEDVYIEEEEMNSTTFADLFRKTMDEVVVPQSLVNFDDPITSWVDEVEEESDLNFRMITQGEIDNNIELTRSLKYKKPERKLAMHTISSLQHGSMLKSRILDCFFTSCDIRYERIRQLPHMLVWLKEVKDKISQNLYKSLTNYMIDTIHKSSGTEPAKIARVIQTSVGQYSVPISTLDSLINDRPMQQVDMFDMILQENDDQQYESDSELSE
jgi:hypothetical protein